MTDRRKFKSRRDHRPPTPFDIEFEVEEFSKVNQGTEEEPIWVEQATGEWVVETRTFHFTHRFPGQLGLDIQAADPTDPSSIPQQTRAIEELLQITVVEPEFHQLRRDSRYVIDSQIIHDLIEAILEEGSNPTAGSPPS